ncbi:MAG: GNAT family N-acetyltransferase [Anaerolineae bacterium]|nr:GNAT family N-acetyltransferase [Anaerolineae bacterium]MDW8173107.1 GNAT family N-acetyltransferase [Anaerolineae bacterium]
MLNFVIRDALPADIAACLTLEHGYETDQVWQMTIQNEGSAWRVLFRTERLPRTVEVDQRGDAERIARVLEAQQGFFVACTKEDDAILGYALASCDRVTGHSVVHELVVGQAFRRRKIGTRLLNVVRRWATERGAVQLCLYVRTHNFPAIQFCQRQGLSFCGYNDQYFQAGDIAVSFGQSLR